MQSFINLVEDCILLSLIPVSIPLMWRSRLLNTGTLWGRKESVRANQSSVNRDNERVITLLISVLTASMAISSQCYLYNWHRLFQTCWYYWRKIESNSTSHNFTRIRHSLLSDITNVHMHTAHIPEHTSTISVGAGELVQGTMTRIEMVGFRYHHQVCVHARGSCPVCGSLWKWSWQNWDTDQFSIALKIRWALYNKCFALQGKCRALMLLRKSSDCQ